MAPLDLLLANRAYLDHDRPPGAAGPAPATSGGLLAAVRPVIAPWDGRTGTTWVGAGMGAHDRDWVDERGFEVIETPRGPLRHRRLFFDDATWGGHYADAANGFLWPLLHLARQPLPEVAESFPPPVTPSAAGRDAFRAVNAAFAGAAAEQGSAASCWIHDYQLALAPAMLRERGFAGRIGFFLHTPFPDLQIAEPFLDDDGRALFAEVVEGMLGADLLGFQTEDDAARFERAVSGLACGMAAGDGRLRVAGRSIRIGAFPVGIDVDETLEAARSGALPEAAGPLFASGLPVVVALERADYTKGVPERLRAVAQAYRRGARFAYAGFSSPTRAGVAAYDRLTEAIEEAASEAGEAAGEAGCPFLQAREALAWPEVVALMREAQVVFTSSLADGMNLVPLQAAVAQSVRPAAERGTVVAGRGAGVTVAYADCLGEGLTAVDALDPEAMVATLTDAVAGRLSPVTDRFVALVRERDARRWGESFLAALQEEA